MLNILRVSLGNDLEQGLQFKNNTHATSNSCGRPDEKFELRFVSCGKRKLTCWKGEN